MTSSEQRRLGVVALGASFPLVLSGCARLSAACTVAVLPVILAGWVAQKRLVRGLAMGAVK